MRPFSIVLPVKDEARFLPYSLNSAIDLRPDEIVFVVDANARGRMMAEVALRICRKRVYNGMKIVEVERNPTWNFYQAWVRRVGYLAAKNDVILTFDVDNILQPAILAGLEIVGRDNIAFVTFAKSAALKRGFSNAVRKSMLGARERLSNGGLSGIMRKRLGAVQAKKPFPGLYWMYRPFYLELVPEDEIRRIYNGEDTFVENKFANQTKYVHEHNTAVGSMMLNSVENEELPWRQFEYGIWLGARGVKIHVPLINTVLRVYPHVISGYFTGRAMRPEDRAKIAHMNYLELTHTDIGKRNFK